MPGAVVRTTIEDVRYYTTKPMNGGTMFNAAYAARFTFAHLTRCAVAILRRADADIVRLLDFGLFAIETISATGRWQRPAWFRVGLFTLQLAETHALTRVVLCTLPQQPARGFSCELSQSKSSPFVTFGFSPSMVRIRTVENRLCLTSSNSVPSWHSLRSHSLHLRSHRP